MKFFRHFSGLILIWSLFAITSCQHDIDLFVPDNNVIGQTLNPVPVQGSVTGKVTNEFDEPVIAAVVKSGSNTTTTDNRGLFRFTNISLDKYSSVVTVEVDGYFKGIRTFSAADGRSVITRIKLIPKLAAGTVDAVTGGLVTLPNNAIITLLPNSVVIKSSGQPYTGTINIFAAAIDPTSADIAQTIPGSFQAIDPNNFRVLLKSYGMMAVQLEGQSGELLQIATGKTARLRFSIPSTLSAEAPASIPLWALNETDGLWKQEGQATKTGNAYEGDVTHFSFWNCDVPFNAVFLEMNINTANGPLIGSLVKISRLNNAGASYGYTDTSGYVGGFVFSNETLLLEVVSSCNQPIFSQQIGPFTQNSNLGNITVTIAANNQLSITGSAVNCSSSPVTDGYAMIYADGMLFNTPIINGNFSANITTCSAVTSPVEVIAIDELTQQQSDTWTGTSGSGNINTGPLNCCVTSTIEFINYTIDNNGYGFSFVDSLAQSPVQGSINAVFSGSNGTSYMYFQINYVGVAVGSSQPLVSFVASYLESGFQNTVIGTPINVQISEFGSVGQYIAGSFSGIITGTTDHFVNCEFRVRRQF